jgi:hypothetical protein
MVRAVRTPGITPRGWRSRMHACRTKTTRCLLRGVWHLVGDRQVRGYSPCCKHLLARLVSLGREEGLVAAPSTPPGGAAAITRCLIHRMASAWPLAQEVRPHEGHVVGPAGTLASAAAATTRCLAPRSVGPRRGSLPCRAVSVSTGPAGRLGSPRRVRARPAPAVPSGELREPAQPREARRVHARRGRRRRAHDLRRGADRPGRERQPRRGPDMRAQHEQVFRNIQAAWSRAAPPSRTSCQLTAYVRDMSQLAAYRGGAGAGAGDQPAPREQPRGVPRSPVTTTCSRSRSSPGPRTDTSGRGGDLGGVRLRLPEQEAPGGEESANTAASTRKPLLKHG